MGIILNIIAILLIFIVYALSHSIISIVALSSLGFGKLDANELWSSLVGLISSTVSFCLAVFLAYASLHSTLTLH